MEYCSAIKKKEILPFVATRIDLEGIMQSEIRARQMSYGLSYVWNLQTNKNKMNKNK